MARIPRNSVGLAGEYAVLSQLALRGYEASLTLGHTKSIDILLFCPTDGRRLEIEVKTNLEDRRRPTNSALWGKIATSWQMNEKHEDIEHPTLYYCFVNIINPLEPGGAFAVRYFIVPSAVVAAYLRKSHQLWLGADATHQDTPRRLFMIGEEPSESAALQAPLAATYEDNWLFGNRTWDVERPLARHRKFISGLRLSRAGRARDATPPN
jgi:hypothetical protein